MHQVKRKRLDEGESSDKRNRSTHTDELERRLNRLKGHVEGFTNSFDDVLESLVACISERKELKDKLKSAQQQVVQLTQDIEQISGEQHNAPDLDNTLENQFIDLKQLIRSLTFDLCGRQILPSTSSGLPDHVKTALAAVSGVPATQLLKSKLHARYFIQALIWRLLCDHLLTNPFLIWGKDNEIGDFIRRAQNSQKVSINRRQRWRTVTGRLLVDIATPRPARVTDWQKMLAAYIGPLVEDKHKDNIEKHIEPILEGAIELAKNLAQSRTMCVIQRRGPDDNDGVSQKYDDKWMEVVEKAIVPYEDIDFLVTPALVQLTNSLGDKFKNPRVIIKAEVCHGRGRVSVHVPPTLDSSLTQGRGTETASGRQSRRIDRLGQVADDDELNQHIGDDVEEVRDDGSDDYKGETQ
ncbi:hypothetical protein FHL15_002957 [Xylaria flabelliformis]|uniref:Uncharacterized protein n=1 Tax=Xylaria flabelliformis TaxID=2512241 RepID=A0A553I7R0_9PEZI|nr:hypothetical protein FHL15_002957 [Xylaria flabelliformis]